MVVLSFLKLYFILFFDLTFYLILCFCGVLFDLILCFSTWSLSISKEKLKYSAKSIILLYWRKFIYFIFYYILLSLFEALLYLISFYGVWLPFWIFYLFDLICLFILLSLFLIAPGSTSKEQLRHSAK